MFNHILGYSHGIRCLTFESGSLVLVNPAIRELPDSGSTEQIYFPIGVGFGYDPKSNTFKVI